MKTYALIEEMGKPLAFHAAYNWQTKYMEQMNRFISVHALGFPYYNILHMTNLVINGIFERFPKLRTMWIEGGVAWVPFLMQRLDNEYMMRPSEAPLLKRMPSEYMAEQYYATQPLELTRNRKLLKRPSMRSTPRRSSASRPTTRTGLRSALDGLRSLVPLRGGQAQHPGRQRGQAVRPQALAARQGRQAGLRRLSRRGEQSAPFHRRHAMEFPSSGMNALTVEAFDTTRHLAHAAKQASERGFDKITIVDADTHHDEVGSFRNMINYIDSPVERHLMRAASNEGRRPMVPLNISYQDQGGRLQRFAARKLEQTPANVHRDITLTRRSMAAMGATFGVLYPRRRCGFSMQPKRGWEFSLALCL